MTDEELHDVIEMLRRRRTDFEYVEAKRAQKALPKRLWESLSSFGSQPGGGIIILGLHEEDGFAAVGIDDVKKVQSDLASLCDDMVPPLRPLIRVHEFEGQQLIVAEIPEVSMVQKPCHYRGSGLYTGSYIRVGDGDRQMTQYEVHACMENRAQPRHDLQLIEGTQRSDLDEQVVADLLKRVRARRTRVSKMTDEDLLIHLDVVSSSGQLTLGGLLCCAKFPQKWFPSLAITFVHYPGTRGDELSARGERFLDNRRFDGPLPAALDDALDAIVGAMRKRSLIEGLIRQEIPEYPPIAVREALVNAVGHRDYSTLARGSQVQVQLFQNRLEIQNPGGLYGPVNMDNLGEPGIQAARNQHLIQLLEDLGPAENRGTGISTMTRETREAQMTPPEFQDSLSYFRVVFSNDTLLDDDTVDWLNRFSGWDLTQGQRLALAYTLHQQEINNGSYCRLTGADSRTATTELRGLVDAGLMTPNGSHRWTTYSLSTDATGEDDDAPETVRRRIPAFKRRELIVDFVRAAGEATAREISDGLQISRSTVNYDIRKLVSAGRFDRTTAEANDTRSAYRLTDRERGVGP